MTELKILKDFETLKCEDYSGSNLIKEDELRQEAIKWIKELKKSDNHNHSTCFPGSECDWCAGKDSQVEWIKHFFNITEEDLK